MRAVKTASIALIVVFGVVISAHHSAHAAIYIGNPPDIAVVIGSLKKAPTSSENKVAKNAKHSRQRDPVAQR